MHDAKCHQARARNEVTERFGRQRLVQRRFWTGRDACFRKPLSDCHCREGGGSAFGSRNDLWPDIRIGAEFEAIWVALGGVHKVSTLTYLKTRDFLLKLIASDLSQQTQEVGPDF
jgi:hypothetical protein